MVSCNTIMNKIYVSALTVSYYRRPISFDRLSAAHLNGLMYSNYLVITFFYNMLWWLMYWQWTLWTLSTSWGWTRSFRRAGTGWQTSSTRNQRYLYSHKSRPFRLCPARPHFCGFFTNRDFSLIYSLYQLKWQCHEIICFWFFSWISFPQASDYTIRAVLNFFLRTVGR